VAATGASALLSRSAAAAPAPLKIATSAKLETPLGKTAAYLRDQLATGANSVAITLYAGGAMGADSSAFAKLRAGQLDGAFLDLAAASSGFRRALALHAPGVLTTPRAFDEGMARFRPTLDALYTEKGLVVQAHYFDGMTRVFSTGTELTAAGALEGAPCGLLGDDLTITGLYAQAKVGGVVQNVTQAQLEQGTARFVTGSYPALKRAERDAVLKRYAPLPVAPAVGLLILRSDRLQALSSAQRERLAAVATSGVDSLRRLIAKFDPVPVTATAKPSPSNGSGDATWRALFDRTTKALTQGGVITAADLALVRGSNGSTRRCPASGAARRDDRPFRTATSPG
jgi:hypothetical protein